MSDFNNEPIKLVYNSKYEILTPDGFKKFDGVIIGRNTLVHIILENNTELKCTHKHKILINELREYNTVDKLNIGDTVFTTNGLIKIKSMYNINEISTVYDLFNVHDNHIYDINDIRCHQCLYLDEFAFVKSHIANDFIASVFPTISSGNTTKLIVTSTPNGLNHFYDMWEKGADTEEQLLSGTTNGFMKSDVAWNKIPGRTEEWARDQIKAIGQIRFNQEYACEFIGSVSTLIDHNLLKTIKHEEPIKIPKLPTNIRIFELPRSLQELEHRDWEYVASLDSGYGVYKDYTVLQIVLVKSSTNLHQVAVYSTNNLDIEEFCKKAAILLKKYHDPGLIIEQNGPGIAALKYFQLRAEYENLLHFDPRGFKTGLWVTPKTKLQACVLFKTFVQRKFLKIKDKDTIKEMFSFGRLAEMKWGGMGGNHDDHITSMYWIPFYVSSPMFSGNVEEVDMSMQSDDMDNLTQQDREEESNLIHDMRNPDKFKQTMTDSTIYGGENESQEIEYDEDDDGVAGTSFRLN